MSDLTATEQQHVRAAVRFLRVRFGMWAPLAKALHMNHGALASVVRGRKSVSAGLAVRVARLTNVGVDNLLDGKYPPPGTCPYCGHHADEAAQ